MLYVSSETTRSILKEKALGNRTTHHFSELFRTCAGVRCAINSRSNKSREFWTKWIRWFLSIHQFPGSDIKIEYLPLAIRGWMNTCATVKGSVGKKKLAKSHSKAKNYSNPICRVVWSVRRSQSQRSHFGIRYVNHTIALASALLYRPGPPTTEFLLQYPR